MINNIRVYTVQGYINMLRDDNMMLFYYTKVLYILKLNTVLLTVNIR